METTTKPTEKKSAPGIQLSDRINSLAESATLLMSKLGRELAAKGIDVISLSLGEPDFPTPHFVNDAAKKGIDEKFFYYTPVSGYLELRKAIAQKLKRENNFDYEPDQIVVSTGAKQSLANLVLCVINPGDEVIVPTPYWVSYSEMIKLAGGIPVFVDAGMENDFKITAKQLADAITPKTRMFMFSSPCNPTGSVYSEKELAAFAEVFAQHTNICIVSDEIYEYINFGEKHASIASFASIKDSVVVVNGLSKGFSMTGWRLGYLAAPKAIAQACDKLQGQTTSNACSITQRAAIAAFEAGIESVKEMKEAFLKRRNLVYKLLNEMEGVKTNLPVGAFYFFPDVSYYFGKSYLTPNPSPNGEGRMRRVINTAEDLCIYLLEEGHITLVTGEAFGAPNHIRISYAASEEKLTEAMRRMKEALKKLVKAEY